MNYIKTTLLSALMGLLPMVQANAQGEKVLREKDPEFFKTAEARRIGDQLLVWRLEYPIANTDRAACTMLSGRIAAKYGAEGLLRTDNLFCIRIIKRCRHLGLLRE